MADVPILIEPTVLVDVTDGAGHFVLEAYLGFTMALPIGLVLHVDSLAITLGGAAVTNNRSPLTV